MTCRAPFSTGRTDAGARSALATATLQDMGYEKVANMDGGFKGWTEAGGPVEPAK